MPVVDIDLDVEALRMEGLLDWAQRELDELRALLPAAIDAQWLPGRVPLPREDTDERSTGRPSDPTAETALDERRLSVREQVIRSEHLIRKTLVVLRGVRLALEKALDAWEGEPSK